MLRLDHMTSVMLKERLFTCVKLSIPVGRQIPIDDQSSYRCVVRKVDLSGRDVSSCATVAVQEVEDSTEQAILGCFGVQ